MKWAVRLAAIVAGVLVGVWWWSRSPAQSVPARPHGPAESAADMSERDRPPAAPRAGDAPDPASPARPRVRLDPGTRAALETAIERARTRRGSPRADRPDSAGPADPTVLALRDRTGSTSDWEKRQLGVLNELLGECYDLGRAEDPRLAGKVMLLFTVAGEPEVGGLVSDVSFDETGTTIAQPTLRECMQEALYALELEPPPEGIQVSRQITLDLAPDE